MGSYRKKPVVIEAFQHDGCTAFMDWPEWIKAAWNRDVFPLDEQRGNKGPLTIRTLEGDHRCDVGDWIICGVKRELYPCKSDIFAMTYEEA